MKRGIAAVAVLGLLAACSGKSGESARVGERAPRADLSLRIVDNDCRLCQKMEYADGNGGNTTTLSVTRAFANARDVESISLLEGEEHALVVRFKPGSSQQVLRATSRNIGREVAVVVGHRAIFVGQVTGAFSTMMMVSSQDAGEQRRKFDALTGPPSDRN
jgi:hypothetical protein